MWRRSMGRPKQGLVSLEQRRAWAMARLPPMKLGWSVLM